MGVPSGLIGFDRIVTDSRDIRSGDLFWALRGARHDGHSYIDEAFKKGAAACVAQPDRTDNRLLPMLAVEDTLQALQDFAGWYQEQQDALVIGVTGSVGKTTTRHMIHTVLRQQYRGIESPQNFNNQIGVPLTLLDIDTHHEFAVVEMAASQLGEIRRLCEIAQPEVGIVTRIAPAHLKQFGDISHIAQAKGELIEALPCTGFAVLNGDDEYVRALAQRAACKTIFVGEQRGNDLVASEIECENGLLRFRVGSTRFTVTAVGRHHVTAALAAIAVAREIDVREVEIVEALSRFEPVAGRCCSQPIGEWTVIDDSYNASPESMRAACEVLRDWQQCNQKVLIAGDMRELGKQTEQFHRELGQQIAQAGIHRLIVTGEHALHVAAGARDAGMDAGRIGICSNSETEQLLLGLWLEPRDVVLLKGSRAERMERFLRSIQLLADDRQIEHDFPHRAVA